MSESASESAVEAPQQTTREAPRLRGAAVAFIFVTILLGLARARPDRADPAEAGGELRRQRYREGRADFRAVRHRLGADAVRLLAAARRPVRPVRPAAGDAVVQFRARARLCADGAGAVADLAVRRPADLRHHLGEHSTAFAYIADVTPPERRAAVFGKIGAAFGAGFILGPALGGLLGGMIPRLPFWVAAGLSFANALYGLLILPESLPRERRSPFRWKSANPVGALQLLRSDRVLAGLSVVNFLAQSRMWCCRPPSCSMRPIATAGARRRSG